LAEALPLVGSAPAAAEVDAEGADAGPRSTCADVAALLGLPLALHGEVAGAAADRSRPCRARSDPWPIAWSAPRSWLLLVRGDHDLNEVKAGKAAWRWRASASPPRPRSSITSAAGPATSGPIGHGAGR
jgi:prolyl-tRNA synthetase